MEREIFLCRLLPERTCCELKHTENRNVHIELMRLAACLMVIMIHTKLPDIPAEGTVDRLAVLTYCLDGDAVAWFFVITGCFLYAGGKSFGHVLRKYVSGILLPALIVVWFLMAAEGYLGAAGVVPGAGAFHFPDMETYLSGILRMDNLRWGAGFGAYWYIFRYGTMLLWYPVIRAIAEQEKGDRILVWLVLVKMVFTLFELLEAMSGGYSQVLSNLQWLSSAPAFTILGHLLYKHREKMRGARRAACAGLIFLVCTLGKYLAQMHIYNTGGTAVLPEMYDSVFSFGSSAAAFALFMAVPVVKRAGEAVSFLARYTFYIYLVHIQVIQKLTSMGVMGQLRDRILAIPSYALNHLLYEGAVVLLVFFAALPPAILGRSAERGIRMAVRKIKSGAFR